MLLAIAAAVGFFAANQAGMSFETEATPVGQQWLYVACLCGIIICVSVLTGIFRQSEQQSRDEADRARRVADTANRAKGDFLAKMSHEIRTPMNGVLGMTQLALTTELTDEQRDYIEAARESAEGLLVVVNDILDFSRLEAGRLELRPQGFRVRDLIRRTMTLLAVRADADLVNVTWSVDEAVPEVVIADMGRIRQVLINLVGNAIKFTPQGTVTTFVEMVDAPPATDGREQAVSLAEPPTSPSGQLPTDQQLLAVTVSDTGVGIAEDQQAKIFEEFEQADGSIARMFGGTGLGLAITRGLVTLMNGQVTLESQVDVGSTFRFVIPVALGTPEDLPADDSSFTEPDQQRVERIDGLRILVIDDNRTNQILIRGLLQKQGCDVTIADSGEAALELFQEVEFDLAFMDIEMPGMDGFETTRRIRMLEVDESRLPIFALTAHALPNYGLRCLAAGMDGYLSKPLKMHEVFAILERVAITRDQTGQTT